MASFRDIGGQMLEIWPFIYRVDAVITDRVHESRRKLARELLETVLDKKDLCIYICVYTIYRVVHFNSSTKISQNPRV